MLMTYKLGSDGSILSADATSNRVYNLSSLISTANTRRVLEMSLPLNTNTMLLYGRAPEPETANYGEYGHLDNFSITNLAGSTNIQLGRRLSDDDYTEFKNLEKLMAGMFTVIMNTTLTGAHHTDIDSGSAPRGGGNTYKYSFDGNDVEETSEGAVWRYYVYVTLLDGTVTESILGVFTALPAGYLKIIKVKVLDNGAVQTSDPLVGVSVTLDWEPGQEYVVPF